MSVAELNSGITPLSYNVEYRAVADDAWYSVRLVLNGEKLTVKYDNFSDDHDLVFLPENFKSIEEIKIFEWRFRPISVQLQDKECKNLSAGAAVCAAHSFTDFDVRFYDAVVDDVICRDHCFANGEEQCMCTFVVVWEHGPFKGCLANKKIENICLVQSNPLLDPNVAIFTKIVREKLENRTSAMVIKSGITEQLTLEKKCVSQSQSLSKSWTSEDRIFDHAQRIKEEVDVGGICNQYTVVIDNLDKDLSPSMIAEFIHRLTSVSVRAYVFPSLSSETYTNGAIVLDCEKSFQKVCTFLCSPDHIIMSRRGRPWVINAKMSGHDPYLGLLGNLMPRYQDKLENSKKGVCKDLKIVCSGSEEYKIAKQWRDLFMEFAEHQERLHKSLALEERKILQPSLVVKL